jgi:uncharacterized protein YlxW (UPF0749 family)
MTDCCELALRNGELALRIAYSAFGTIALLLLMFFGYNLRLDRRTLKLEKKNGKEQKQINEIKKEVESLRKTSQRLKTSKFKSSQKLKSKKHD